MEVVSVPASGSVTANACSLRSPLAIFGRYSLLCSSEPCLRSVPMVYIWTWAGPALAPLRLISSRMAQAGREIEAHPAVLLGYQRAEVAGARHRGDELLGVAAFCVEIAPVLVREAGAYLPDAPAEFSVKTGGSTRLGRGSIPGPSARR